MGASASVQRAITTTSKNTCDQPAKEGPCGRLGKLSKASLVTSPQFKHCLDICKDCWLLVDIQCSTTSCDAFPIASGFDTLLTTFRETMTSTGSADTCGFFNKDMKNTLIDKAPVELLKFMFSLKRFHSDLLMHELRKIGREYAELGLTRDHIHEIFDVLFKSIEQCALAVWTAEVEMAWMSALKFVVSYVTLEKIRFIEDTPSVLQVPCLDDKYFSRGFDTQRTHVILDDFTHDLGSDDDHSSSW
jgi:hemoglobin-like flavoprotein